MEVTSGTISGVAFHVTSGSVYQASPDGPIHADSLGATIVLDASPASLGMTDPDRLQLRTLFALTNLGSLQIAAFGTVGDEIDSGLSMLLYRIAENINYRFFVSDSGSTPVADAQFSPPPAIPSGEQWVTTEFYAQDVPGYGAGSGSAMWPLTQEETAPTAGGDVLGCTDGPAMQSTTLDGDRVAYELHSAFIVGIHVVDSIVGPCQPTP